MTIDSTTSTTTTTNTHATEHVWRRASIPRRDAARRRARVLARRHRGAARDSRAWTASRAASDSSPDSWTPIVVGACEASAHCMRAANLLRMRSNCDATARGAPTLRRANKQRQFIKQKHRIARARARSHVALSREQRTNDDQAHAQRVGGAVQHAAAMLFAATELCSTRERMRRPCA